MEGNLRALCKIESIIYSLDILLTLLSSEIQSVKLPPSFGVPNRQLEIYLSRAQGTSCQPSVQ